MVDEPTPFGELIDQINPMQNGYEALQDEKGLTPTESPGSMGPRWSNMLS